MSKTFQQLRTAMSASCPPVVILSGQDADLRDLHGDLWWSLLLKRYPAEKLAATTWYSSQNPWAELDLALKQTDLLQSRKIFKLYIEDLAVLKKKDRQQWLQTQVVAQEATHWLIVMPTLDKRQQQAAWFKSWTQSSLVMVLWPWDTRTLQAYIQQTLRAQGYEIKPELVAMIAERSDHQLAAVRQYLQHIVLAHDKGALTEEDLAAIETLRGQPGYYDLIDAALRGESSLIRSCSWSSSADAQGLAYALVSVLKELTLYAEMQALPAVREDAHGQIRLWPKKEQNYRLACRRHSMVSLRQLLLQATSLDASIKSTMPASAWQRDLQAILWGLAGHMEGKNR